jgi:menaquinone-dependent protoporphyrinogen IX oxidase
MTGMIIYRSKYGATKKYAEWLSEATGFKCVTVKEADINDAANCDVIILGGGIYAGGISCTPFLKKNIGRLKGKKIIVYTCGASPYDKGFMDELEKMNMKDELAGIPVYYCRGAVSMKDMSFKDRTLCKMLQKSLSKKDPKDYAVWESALMECSEQETRDWTDRSYIEQILKAI